MDWWSLLFPQSILAHWSVWVGHTTKNARNQVWIARYDMWFCSSFSQLTVLWCYWVEIFFLKSRTYHYFELGTSQRCIYRTLHGLYKMIKSRLDDTTLCTYYFETIILWATEEKQPEFWFKDEAFPCHSVSELLCTVLKWLHIQFYPKYFIPTNNTIDHLDYTNLSSDTDSLYYLLQEKEYIGVVMFASKVIDWFHTNVANSIELPTWICSSVIIADPIYNIEDNFINLCNVNFSRQQSSAVECKLSNCYDGLSLYQKAKQCIDNSIKKKYISKVADRPRS